MYTNSEIKRTAKAAFESYTGGTVRISDIVLLEASDDRTYIRFEIKDIEWVFVSYICDRFTDVNGREVECVWVGENTLERIGRRK